MRRAAALALAVVSTALPLAHAQERPQDANAARAARSTDPGPEIASLRERADALTGRVPEGTIDGIRYLLDLSGSRGERRRAGVRSPWLERARRYVAMAERGQDPYVEARGEITLRGYRSAVSETLQAYAVYVPPDYDPARAYPLLIALHGGSSNGNLFLAQTLGVRVPFDGYHENLYMAHRPVTSPPWIVVAPDGFGNSMWRFMGERDVLDVLEDVQRHYHVDVDHVVLHGLSNGGLGSFNVGVRHAWRFAAVIPLAGAPGWIHYVGGRPDDLHMRVLRPLSAWTLIENARNTHLHAHHGRRDPGPMRPAYVEALSTFVERARVPFELDWYATGHDLVAPVHRHGGVFEHEATRRRDPRPAAVTLVTGDYRANRQYWVSVTRIDQYPSLARVDAEVVRDAVTLRTEHVRAMTLHLDGAPLPAGDVTLRVDGAPIAIGARRGSIDLVREGGAWTLGAPRERGLVKRPGLSGPIADAYWESLVHVYGTRDPAHEAVLRQAAERGARSFVPHTHTVRQRVIADRDLSPALAASSHLVLYGSPGDNAVLEAMRERLPLRVEAEAIVVGSTRVEGRRIGTRFIFPSPLSAGHYVLVQAGTDPEAVLAGDTLPAFLPDYVVYDGRRMPDARTNLARTPYLAAGFFDDAWTLDPAR